MANVNKKTTNNFSKGLIMDFSPEKTGNEVLTHALNATLLTFNGNEMSLLNDMGNARVETAFLPEGYVPVGSCEFGDIIYVVSYNPLIDKALIGCFPSPERNISSEELGLNPVTISSSDFLEIKNNQLTGNIKTSSVKKIVFNSDMHPGDQYIIYQESLDALDTSYISDYGNKDHEINKFPKLVKISVVSIEDSGKITYLNSSVKWYDNDYYILDGILKKENKIDLDSYRTMTNSAYATFASKVSGKLALLIELEKITGFSCTWECFLPKDIIRVPWVYTGRTGITNITPDTSLSNSRLLENYGSTDVIWTSFNYLGDNNLYRIEIEQKYLNYSLNKGSSGTYTKFYEPNTNYDIVTGKRDILLNTLTDFVAEYKKGTHLTLNIGGVPQSIAIDLDYVVIAAGGSSRLHYICARTNYTSDNCGTLNSDTRDKTGYLYLPVIIDGHIDCWAGDYDADYVNQQFKNAIQVLYDYKQTTIFDFTDYDYRSRSTEYDVLFGIWGLSTYAGQIDGYGTSTDDDLYKKTYDITLRWYSEYTLIDFNGRIYKKLDTSISIPSLTETNLFGDSNNQLIKRKTPIYFNFNWTTENKNINPKYALLTSGSWKKNDGQFIVYTEDGQQTLNIKRYNEIECYKHNTTGTGTYSGKKWIFTRGYEPENLEHNYNKFILELQYETYASTVILDRLTKEQNQKIFFNVKNIIRDINGLSNTPKIGYYYINPAKYNSYIDNLDFFETYQALLERDNNGSLEIPKLVNITSKEINDDIVNNTFKYPITKHFHDFEIPILQKIEEELIDINQTNFVYEYTVTPAMPYGKLDELSVTGSIDFSKIGKTDINLTKWKYFNDENSTILTWGMDAYTEPDKGIPEVIFEFYDNLGLAAAYHVKNYASYNGQFTHYLNLNSLKGTPDLNNLDWEGNEIFHLKQIINRNDAKPDTVYYYLQDNKYIKVTDLSTLNADITTLCESDAGILYSNWLYGVKIIVRYEYKNILGDYISNKNPIIFYRWLWTNTLFNKYYYNIDDFKSLLFSLNLDMNVDYSIILDLWKLQPTTYRAEHSLELLLSEDELIGATIQHINTDRSKNNVKVNITPGLLDTFNTFTLCSKRALSERNPLNDIEVSVILGDLLLVNYPELPLVKLYSGKSYPLDSNLLEPKIASSLTGFPEYVGPNLSNILGVSVTSEDALDLYSKGRDINKFTNNFCLYNRSYINTELEQSISFSIDLSGIEVLQSPINLYTRATNVLLTPTLPLLPLPNEDVVVGENTNDPNSYTTKRRTRYFTTETRLTSSELETYKTIILNHVKDMSIDKDINTPTLLVTIPDTVTIKLLEGLILSLDEYVYQISRTYQENSLTRREPNKTYIYDEGPTLYSTPIKNLEIPETPDDTTASAKYPTYCFGHNTKTWDIYSDHNTGVGPINDATSYKYRWEYDILYVKASNKNKAKQDPVYLESDENKLIPIKYYYYSSTEKKYYIYDRNSDFEESFEEFVYTEDEVLLSGEKIKVTIKNEDNSTTDITNKVMIIPIKCDINPKFIHKKYSRNLDGSWTYQVLENLISLTLEAKTLYYINSNSNASIYYLTEKGYGEMLDMSAHIDYFKGALNGTSWTSVLVSATDSCLEFSEETKIYLYVIGDPGTEGTIQIYRRVPDYITDSFSYYDANNNFKTINNYLEFKFNSSTQNLTTLMSEGLDLALSGLHYSKFKQYTTTLKDLEVKVVRPYVYHFRDLDYNNLQLVNDNVIAFKNMLFFSADSRHNSYTDIMGTIHKINKYNTDSDKTLDMTRVTNLSGLNAGHTGNISYTRMYEWRESLWNNGMYNFFPIGWGTLTNDDKKQRTSFKRSNVTVKLLGMYAEHHNEANNNSISSTATIGSYIRSSSDYINIADHWREHGALLHALDVLALLTLVYYLQNDTITTDIQAVNDYAYLENNYCVYSRDIIVKIKPFESLENCNHMITLRGIDYQEYINAIINNQNFSLDIDQCNVTCILDSIMKVAPIGFKFNYIMPVIDLSGKSKNYYRVYKVSLDINKPYVTLEGLNLQYRTPYVIGSSDSLINAYGASNINTYSKITLSTIDSDKDNALYYYANDTDRTNDTRTTTRLYATNLGASTLGVNSILLNLKHDDTIDGVPIPLLTFTGTIANKYSWNLYSSSLHGGVYITGLPCNYSDNSYKYFT